MQRLMNTVIDRPHHMPSRGRLIDRFHTAMALYRSRARLAKLDPHMLRDIGIDRGTAEKEAARPIWDAPASVMR